MKERKHIRVASVKVVKLLSRMVLTIVQAPALNSDRTHLLASKSTASRDDFGFGEPRQEENICLTYTTPLPIRRHNPIRVGTEIARILAKSTTGKRANAKSQKADQAIYEVLVSSWS